jgi:hypothetical protein
MFGSLYISYLSFIPNSFREICIFKKGASFNQMASFKFILNQKQEEFKSSTIKVNYINIPTSEQY